MHSYEKAECIFLSHVQLEYHPVTNFAYHVIHVFYQFCVAVHSVPSKECGSFPTIKIETLSPQINQLIVDEVTRNIRFVF